MWSYTESSKKLSLFSEIVIIVFYFTLVYGLLFVPKEFLYLLPIISTLSAVVGRIPQIYLNFKNHHTGQLAFLSCFLTFIGSAVRIFTSMQETGDIVLYGGYILTTLINMTLVIQILMYWKETNKYILNHKKND